MVFVFFYHIQRPETSKGKKLRQTVQSRPAVAKNVSWENYFYRAELLSVRDLSLFDFLLPPPLP